MNKDYKEATTSKTRCKIRRWRPREARRASPEKYLDFFGYFEIFSAAVGVKGSSIFVQNILMSKYFEHKQQSIILTQNII